MKLSQPTEQEEERKRERLLYDINKKRSKEEEAAQLAADTLFRSILDKALGKEKNSPQDTSL